MDDGAFKQCPFCKEQIRSEAMKCRWCGEWLRKPEPESPVPPPPIQQQTAAAQPSDEHQPPPPLETDVRSTQQPKTGIRPSTLKRMSVALLGVCAILFIIILVTSLPISNWPSLTPEDRSVLVGRPMGNLAKIALIAGLGCWPEKRKGYKLLWFSVILTLGMAVMAYSSSVRAYRNRNTATQSLTHVRTVLSNTLTFATQGATGSLPAVPSTGNRVDDMVLHYTHDMLEAIMPPLTGVSQRIQSLQERSVFDHAVLTNSLDLDAELQKRIQAQRIIADAQESERKALEGFQEYLSSRAVSTEDEKGVIRGLQQSIRKNASSWLQVFELLRRKENADMDFLNFMASARDDYILQNGSIVFGSATNSEKYAYLATRATSAQNDMDEARSLFLETAKSGVDILR